MINFKERDRLEKLANTMLLTINCLDQYRNEIHENDPGASLKCAVASGYIKKARVELAEIVLSFDDV